MTDKARALAKFNVSRETIQRLEVYEQLLTRWVKVTNLIGPTELEYLWTRHLVDSLQLKALCQPGQIWVDLGTGAGLPGLVLALDSVADELAHYHLVEPDGRKCAFLREVVRATGAHATVHRARAEDVLPQLGRVNIIASRAMAPLENLVRVSEELLRSGAIGLFPKGRGYRAEVETVSHLDGLVVEVVPSITSDDAAIIRVSCGALGSGGAA